MNSKPRIRHSLQTLQVYFYYRLALSGLLMVMFFTGVADNVIGSESAMLYLYTCVLYVCFAISAFFVFPPRSLRYSQKRVSALLAIDILALLVMVHASGGIQSGIGYLFIITAAMVSIFARGQIAYAYAAFISIAVLADSVYLFHGTSELTRNIFSSGTLGLLVFATCTALQYLTSRIESSVEEAEQQARHIRDLQEMAENIVTRMQTGIIVIDHEMRIELMNASAKQMLDLPADTKIFGNYLAELRELAPLLRDWEAIQRAKESKILKIRPGTEIRINVAPLDTAGAPKNIFYLEDYSAIKQHAQQLKLASLGRLAASIAHEIRNPLGALSHAAQLLNESDSIDVADQRLTEIILNNCGRVNEIIENTLTLSRRREPKPELIDLALWLPQFIQEAQSHHRESITLTIKSQELRTKFDPTHLAQILANLIENGLRFSLKDTGEEDVEIEAGMMASDEKAYIEVKDTGNGVPNERLHEIFEPFYTTDEKGSGLGLYICRELAETNHASLHYKRSDDRRTCFRIDFPHHQRMR